MKELTKIVATFSYFVVTQINFRDWILVYLNIDKMSTYSQYLLFTLTCRGSRAGKDSLKAILSWEAGLKPFPAETAQCTNFLSLTFISRRWQAVVSACNEHLLFPPPKNRYEHSGSGSSSLMWKAVTRWWSEGVLELLSCALWHIACHALCWQTSLVAECLQPHWVTRGQSLSSHQARLTVRPGEHRKCSAVYKPILPWTLIYLVLDWVP